MNDLKFLQLKRKKMILSWKQQQDYQETRYDTEALLIKPGLRSSENEWQCKMLRGRK